MRQIALHLLTTRQKRNRWRPTIGKDTQSDLRVKDMKRAHGNALRRPYAPTQTGEMCLQFYCIDVVGMVPTAGDDCRRFPPATFVVLASRDGPHQALHDIIFGACTSCFCHVAFSLHCSRRGKELLRKNFEEANKIKSTKLEPLHMSCSIAGEPS